MAPSVETVTVKESPLPLPGDDPLSPAQWATLLAFADAVVPSIAPSASANPTTQLATGANDYATTLAHVQQLAGPDVAAELPAQYLAESPSASPAFRENIHRLMAQYIPADVRKQLLAVFDVLELVQCDAVSYAELIEFQYAARCARDDGLLDALCGTARQYPHSNSPELEGSKDADISTVEQDAHFLDQAELGEV